MNNWLLAATFALALALAPGAIASPPENPGPPSGTPGGPPSEFPGGGEFPADPGQNFPSVACEHTPDRPSNVPSWVPIPFADCGSGGANEDSASGSSVLLLP